MDSKHEGLALITIACTSFNHFAGDSSLHIKVLEAIVRQVTIPVSVINLRGLFDQCIFLNVFHSSLESFIFVNWGWKQLLTIAAGPIFAPSSDWNVSQVNAEVTITVTIFLFGIGDDNVSVLGSRLQIFDRKLSLDQVAFLWLSLILTIFGLFFA